jgi:hypothetical protein
MKSADHSTMPSATDDELSASAMPSETIRTIITLVLFVHLFIASIAAIGVMRSYSELFNRLNVKFVSQLEYPNYLLLSRFAFQLTYNRDVDYEGSAEIVLDWDAADEAQPELIAADDKLVLFDPEEIKLPIRRQRYLSLIRRMTDVAASQPPSPREVDLPIAVSKVLLAEADNPEGIHRFRLLRLPTPAPQYANEAQPPVLPPAYQGNIALRDGDLEFTKADRAGLVSPPVQDRTTDTPTIPPVQSLPDAPPLIPRLPLPLDNPSRSDGNR